MISRCHVGDGYYLCCDGCGEEADDCFDEFADAVNFKRDQRNGWRSKRVGEEWQDLCPACAEEGAMK